MDDEVTIVLPDTGGHKIATGKFIFQKNLNETSVYYTEVAIKGAKLNNFFIGLVDSEI